MRMLLKGLVAALAVLATPLTAQAAPAPAPQTATAPAPGTASPTVPPAIDARDLEAWLDGFMPYALAKGNIPGAVVVVVRGNGPLLAKGYGFSDQAKRSPVDPDATLFRPGSVSKLFTWTAVMQEVEAGKLDLDRDVNAYLDFTIPPLDGKPITLRQIMTHTAGFEESVRHLITNDPKAVLPLGDLMKRALPQRVFAPGTTPAYSNYATALAGYIVQRVSGEPLEAHIENHQFTPLGMSRSSFRQPLPAGLQPLMSKGYNDKSNKPQPFEQVLPWPAGSLSSSGADMGRFMTAHLNNGAGLMKPETASQMHDFAAPGLGPLNRMALGFYEQWVNGHRAIGHGGDTTLFHSYLWLFPDADVGVYISVNSGGSAGAAASVRTALFHGFTDRYLPGKPVTAQVDAATARSHAALLAGNYVGSRGSFTNFLSLFGLLSQAKIVVDEDGRITLPALDGMNAGKPEWVETAPFVWVDRNSGDRLAAEVQDGQVVRMSTDALSPFTVYRPAPVGTNAAWLLPALGVAVLLIALAALGWPVRALVRRHFGATFPLKGSALTAWRLSRLAAWGVIVAVGGWLGFVAAFTADIGSVGGPLDWLIQSLRVLTPLASLGLVLAAGWHLLLCLRQQRRWTMRLGAVLLLASGLLCVWVTMAFNLYGFGLVY
ncbi:serine hydrolase domain-containing protein [Sandarakinorhabdus sp.]|uniref:serine hydrolase domain-containing protein n=1 Tax=Sandarakinorhabdus sp. TaxID=1916663 RepID=UPI0028A70BAD|nr:serine hydrolase domain-containing protein [Sandarakinorhabdus sp.]